MAKRYAAGEDGQKLQNVSGVVTAMENTTVSKRLRDQLWEAGKAAVVGEVPLQFVAMLYRIDIPS